MKALLKPIQVGDLAIANRIAMAPLTRARVGERGVPAPLNASRPRRRAP